MSKKELILIIKSRTSSFSDVKDIFMEFPIQNCTLKYFRSHYHVQCNGEGIFHYCVINFIHNGKKIDLEQLEEQLNKIYVEAEVRKKRYRKAVRWKWLIS